MTQSRPVYDGLTDKLAGLPGSLRQGQISASSANDPPHPVVSCGAPVDETAITQISTANTAHYDTAFPGSGPSPSNSRPAPAQRAKGPSLLPASPEYLVKEAKRLEPLLYPTLSYSSSGHLEQAIGMMHFRNVMYTRSQVLKNRAICKLAKLEETRMDYEPLCTIDRFENIRDDLAHYSTAIRDYKHWMDTHSDPSMNEVSRAKDHGIHLAVMEMETVRFNADQQPTSPNRVVFTKDNLDKGWEWIINQFRTPPIMVRKTETQMNTTFHHRRHRRALDLKETKAFVGRLSHALFGGFALVGPMLIMALHPTRLTQLVTTSMCVFALAVILAWRLKDAQSKDIVGITAAYTAVLVVFVGANSGSTSGGSPNGA